MANQTFCTNDGKRSANFQDGDYPENYSGAARRYCDIFLPAIRNVFVTYAYNNAIDKYANNGLMR